MPVHTWADNDVPTASDLNTNFRDQVVSTVTSATRPAGTEGQVIYETDTDLYQAYNGGWIPFGNLGAWTTWTPAVVQSGAVTVTVTKAAFTKIGRFVSAHAILSVTGTGTANNSVTVSLPVTAESSALSIIGSGYLRDSSVPNIYPCIPLGFTTTTMRLLDTTAATNSTYLGQTGAAFSAALASGDTVLVIFTYESAT